LLQTKSGPINIVGIPWPNRHNIALKDDYFIQSATDITDHISQAMQFINQANTGYHELGDKGEE